MVHAANKEKYSSINRIAIAERASVEEVDGPSPYSAIFISFCDENATMTSETLENAIVVRFYFTLCYVMLTNLSLSKNMSSLGKCLIRGLLFLAQGRIRTSCYFVISFSLS